MASVDVDIDFNDYLSGCDSWEKQKIMDSLWQDGYAPKGLFEDGFES